MTDSTSSFRRGWVRTLLIPLIVYAGLAFSAGMAQRELINTDAICYLRHALYLSQGNWSESVSGYWSPLLIWSLAPLVGLGMDGVYAGHLCMVIWGVVLMVASYYFLRRFTALRAPWDMIVMLILATKVAGWVARLITPDIALAAALLTYSGITLNSQLLRQRKLAVAAGALGGVAYLAKSYGLPFFVVHFTCAIALHTWFRPPTTTLRHVVHTYALAMAAFALVAGPWIGILSVKYQRPTFSTVARVAHTVVGPPDQPRAHPTDQLRTPPPGRLTVWEVPAILPYNAWSPLDSAAYFKHQVKVVMANAGAIIETLNHFDLLHLFPAALVLIPLFLARNQQRDRTFQTFWTWSAVGIYTAGFLPIFFEDRYVASYVWPVCFLYLCDFLLRPSTVAADRIAPNFAVRFGLPILKALCVLSFVAVSLNELQECLRARATPAWRMLAGELQRVKATGPIASSPGSKNEGLLTAYHLSTPFFGPVKGTNTSQIEASLQEHQVRTLLVRDAKWPFMENFLRETTWGRATLFEGPGARVHVLTNPLPLQPK